MRDAICSALLAAATDPRFVFLTGDLGYKALEPLRDAAGSRFINAGISEQNMIGVAAGLARAGFKPWAYSIAPFVYARPFEQIRNDVCLHDLSVRLIGNGGGYGYGVMGSTHHAIEDYGALLGLQHMRVAVPAFDSDVHALVPELAEFDHPAYLRLGRDEKPADFRVPEYCAWRKLTTGGGAAIVAVGPLAGVYLDAILGLPSHTRPSLWALTELPVDNDSIPFQFWVDVEKSRRLVVAEEHVAHGSAGQAVASLMLATGRTVSGFTHLHATGYPSGRYGSQAFHRKENGLDSASLMEAARILTSPSVQRTSAGLPSRRAA